MAIQDTLAAPRSTAPTTLDRAALLGRIPELAAEIGREAARRDRERELPFEAFTLFRRSGLSRLRIPQHLGGPGGSIVDLIGMIATLAAADSNVAHALRSHFNFTEALSLNFATHPRDELLGRVLDGALFGGAGTEVGTPRPKDMTTTLRRDGDRYRLNGRKYYATGTAYADYAFFSALDEEGHHASALLPTDRAGIEIQDDWDGMGQRLTASGGVHLNDVEVLPHEIGVRTMSSLVGRHTSTLRQLHLAACCAGIVRNILSDACDYVRTQARSANHSHAEVAAQDHFVQKIVGELSATRFAIDAVVAEAARALDRSATAIAHGDNEAEALVIESALVTAQSQIVIGKLGLKAAEDIFETGGGSATSRALGFDRHWRNLRTILNHNPLLHKARVVGDYELNGTTTHLEEGRVF